MSCDTCLKSDCMCICLICGKHEPQPVSTPIKITRRRKKLQIEWISCNSCNKWVHPKCTGLTNKEITHFKSLSKQTKTDQFFKCLKCSLKAAKRIGIDYSQLSDNNLIDSFTQTSKTTIILENKSTEISKISTEILNIEKQHTSKVVESTESKSSKTLSEPEQIQDTDFSLSQTSSKASACTSNTEKSKSGGESLKQAANNNTKNHKYVRIIDNITPDLRPKSSVEIKKRISETASHNIEIDFTYVLPRGGIAVILKTEEDLLNLEKDLQNIYPGSTCSIPQSLRRHSKIVIKNINPNISTKDLIQDIKNNFQEEIQIRRFHSSYNHKPLPIVSISCTYSLCGKFLSEGIYILGKQYQCEKYNKPAVRCFNCQLFGHISKHCRNKTTCHNCGKSHPTHNPCTNHPFCANCKLPGHPSISRECPKYLKVLNKKST